MFSLKDARPISGVARRAWYACPSAPDARSSQSCSTGCGAPRVEGRLGQRHHSGEELTPSKPRGSGSNGGGTFGLGPVEAFCGPSVRARARSPSLRVRPGNSARRPTAGTQRAHRAHSPRTFSRSLGTGGRRAVHPAATSALTGPSTRSIAGVMKRPRGSSWARTAWKRSHSG